MANGVLIVVETSAGVVREASLELIRCRTACARNRAPRRRGSPASQLSTARWTSALAGSRSMRAAQIAAAAAISVLVSSVVMNGR